MSIINTHISYAAKWNCIKKKVKKKRLNETYAFEKNKRIEKKMLKRKGK